MNNTIDYTYTHPGYYYYDNAIRLWYKLNTQLYYIPPYIRNSIPFKTLCNHPIGQIDNGLMSFINDKFYNEYEYISSMISFVTIRPQKFM